jgi:hypothetical protein
MSRKYKFHNPEGVYFITFAVQVWFLIQKIMFTAAQRIMPETMSN